jgi:hypothetical protein
MNKSNVVFSPETRLTECDERQVTIGLPGPLNERLDRLVERADLEGARTNRKELLGALILEATESPVELAQAVVALRKARAKDAAVSGNVGDVLEFRQHQPGPRRRRRSAS